ncbi:S-layer homology domain-containing protein [Patescibacteria group bacterium]|nr:S-layer homology domain-containing protein [Patescibacteria group bacterium]
MRALVTALLLLLPQLVFALPPDVPANDWFTEAISEFVDKGYIDSSVEFKPSDLATRSAFIMIMVELKGGASDIPETDENESFHDVHYYNEFFSHFEEAARQGWMKGIGNCFGQEYCNANPYGLINRAEAAALLARAFRLENTSEVPSFDDNEHGQWYTDHINVAAGNCILKGDANARRVRPADNMNRAEMIVMLHRLHAGFKYPDCDMQISSGIIPQSNNPQVSNNNSVISEEYCDETAWACSDWTECINGSQTRNCIQVDAKCLNPIDVRPKNFQKCVSYDNSPKVGDLLGCSEWGPCDYNGRKERECRYYAGPKRQFSPNRETETTSCNIDLYNYWKNVHDEMLEKAKDISTYSTDAGKAEGLRQLSNIESEFVLQFNRYIKDICHERSMYLNCPTIARELDRLEKEFRALPVIFY